MFSRFTPPKTTKYQLALFICLLFHVSGAIGIVASPYQHWFVQNTTLNLCLMAALLVYTQRDFNRNFFLFLFLAFAVGMLSEIIGVNTQWLFGHYRYGEVLGPKLAGVPYLIGIQWIVTVFCSGILARKLLLGLTWVQKWPEISRLGFIFLGATLTTLFDLVLEPVAIQLGFWTWLDGGQIPLYNYVCWFGISAFLLYFFDRLNFPKKNIFAVQLLLIQVAFFLVVMLANGKFV
jgi:bisanhydrobacterioruberin hydratase